MKDTAREQIKRSPEGPGVYILKGKSQQILYVGKAIRLRDRLKSYLNLNRNERPSMTLLIPQVEEVEWLLTDNEKEALLLENSLIKAHRPRYNISLRDDKSYVSLRLTQHLFPRLFVTRQIDRDGSEYFGPYSSVSDLRQTLKLVQKIFLTRDCSDSFYDSRTRPCLRYQIKRCSAPCVGYVSQESYAEQVRHAKIFLSGNKELLISRLQSEMNQASMNLKYEEAAILRDRLTAIEETLRPQKVESRRDHRDADTIGLAGDSQATLIKVLKIRKGRLIGADEFLTHEPICADKEITRAFIAQYYLADFPGHEVPSQLLMEKKIEDLEMFQILLSERSGGKVKLLTPKRGAAHRLLKLAQRNAASSLAERKRKSDRTQKLLSELAQKLSLKSIPKRIEGYDISSFHGAQPIGSMVVFIDGEPDKSKYRHYGIRSVKGSNDFAMLREMFERRFQKLTESDRPGLILVDGGRGQLRQALDVLKNLNIQDLAVVSMAKEKELKSKSGKRYAPERLFLPGQKNPLVFPSSSPLLHLLQRVRDEAHRFGITRHRRARKKETFQSILQRIPGVGLKRQRALLKSFGSVEGIQNASMEQLQAVSGFNKKVAQGVQDFFKRLPQLTQE